ncbi:MAG TPA: hypothetical protein VF345_00395, partial [Chthoniobacterales bacterium]
MSTKTRSLLPSPPPGGMGKCAFRNAERKWLALPVGTQPATLTAQMRRKIDQPEARRIYGRRLAIVEPVF